MKELKKYKVSIVTAVYNVAEYLGEMIESIIAQTMGFENIQLILVDDGSRDASGEICDKYAAQFANITVVHKENGGVSSARNAGLKHVEGSYVNFTDADDMLEKDALQKMYVFMERNKKEIDLAAIPMQYYGRNESHPLNYKFKKTTVVDLEKQYDYIQLSISSALVKSACFESRCFDEKLSYAEDAQLILDILLDKMRYGVICGTKYLYRKRSSDDSAMDKKRGREEYYIPCVERFIIHSLDNAVIKKGYIPRFVQYTCMYDLQWRLGTEPVVEKGVFDQNKEERYKKLILKALQYIDDQIIWEQKHIDNKCKLEIVSLKYQHEDSGSRQIFEFIDISSDNIILEGVIKNYSGFGDAQLILRTEMENTSSIEYIAELTESEAEGFFEGERITEFRFDIKRNVLLDDIRLQLYRRCNGEDTAYQYIWFGKFFPLTNQLKTSYMFENGILLTYSGTALCLSQKIGSRRRLLAKCEKSFQCEMLAKKDKKVFRGWLARMLYCALRPFKKKEIWLISDRLMKADDNGETFFTYMNTVGKKTNIKTYFVLEKTSKDYERLHKIGKVVSYHTTMHKILSLLCDKKISSQADEYVFNRFFNLSYLYGDIQHRQKFVFLQHGVTKDDSSKWLKKTETNISLFVTATNMEYQSILEYAYGYDDRQIVCTGFPRYDYLYDNAQGKNMITFMPTWRLYLAHDFDDYSDTRRLIKGFENSAYCQMYHRVLSDAKLFEAAEKFGYKVKLMLHPAMPRECTEYFHCSREVEILDRNVRYRDLYADSKLIVTDYSSAVFDFAYLRKPIIYYHQDADEFFSGKHVYSKGYYDYERDGFGEVEYTAEGLVNRIIEYMENGCRLKDVYRERIEKTFPYHDKENCRRVYEEIRKL